MSNEGFIPWYDNTLLFLSSLIIIPPLFFTKFLKSLLSKSPSLFIIFLLTSPLIITSSSFCEEYALINLVLLLNSDVLQSLSYLDNSGIFISLSWLFELGCVSTPFKLSSSLIDVFFSFILLLLIISGGENFLPKIFSFFFDYFHSSINFFLF